ncbi:type II toxin-antitoxin system RelE/ParE family toxin [Candidatus Regiella insecticola]|uniref:type II toxin-antitoxin system RelE/ParE family toxin n=1 Tax=Candidatus Regiella insecticola TaxID=138073 RepID=UPI0005C6540A|nr:type II toxin-antitoxin system RelE/ParE family toxin [Candidatus Regiella insecticola]
MNFYNEQVEQDAINLPSKIRARFLHLLERIEQVGALNEPHSKALGDGLFEIRAKGKEGIARGMYCYQPNNRIMILHVFVKKTQKISKCDLEITRNRFRLVTGGKLWD